MAYTAALKDKLLAEAQRRVAAADGSATSTLSKQRETADKYYRGEPFGNEVSGRSQVVSRDVAQYVDSQMPSLMRVFASGDEVVVFEPTQPQDEEASKQATDYVNWIWRQNDGFLRFHNWFKDGLLYKLGVVKIWWDATPQRTREVYRDLTDEQLAALQGDADIEVGEVETREVPLALPDGTARALALHDVEVVKINAGGRVRVENVPPEEFLFGRRTKDDRESDIFAHQTLKTRAELLAMGFDADVVWGLAGGAAQSDMDSAKLVRFRDVDDANSSAQDADEVEVVEAYFRFADEDEDAPRFWQVIYAGSTLLDCQEVDDHPFACVTPILMPHRLVGLSTADQTMDIQLVKSTIWRQMLDNLYLTNAPQVGVVEGQVNLDDLLTRRPGGVVRMKAAGMLTPIPTPPLGAEPYQMIEYLDSQGEQRTGSTRYNQGLDANSLNKTASGINLIQNAAAQRLELIARVYAETGVKRAFRRILALVQRHQQAPQMIRLRGQWVPMDPRGWSNSMDLTVTVGLGTGNKDQTLAHIMALLNLDQTIVAMQGGVQGPLVTASNIYAKLKKLVEAAGLRSVESYYSDPDSPQMQQAMAQRPPKPDPKMIEAQGKLALEKMQTEAQLQLEQQRAALDAALGRQKAETEAAVARQKAEDAARLAAWEAEQKAEVERLRVASQLAIERFRAGADAAEMLAGMQNLDERIAALADMEQRVGAAAEMVAQERAERERLAAAPAPEAEDEDDMARGPSDEYKAMAAMMQGMQEVVASLAQTTAELSKTQADMLPLIKRAAAPKRAIRDSEGRLVGAEPVE